MRSRMDGWGRPKLFKQGVCGFSRKHFLIGGRQVTRTLQTAFKGQKGSGRQKSKHLYKNLKKLSISLLKSVAKNSPK